MWHPLASWESRSRAWRTTVLILLVHLGLFALALLSFPIIGSLWREGIAGVIPDFYDVVVRQLIAALLGASPGEVAASGTVLTLTTALLSVLTVHLPISYGIGALFDKLDKDRLWSLACYATAFVVLILLQAFAYWYLVA